MIIVIPCGAKKLNRPAMAKDMYTGSYALMCKRYARTLAPDSQIFILSAKYGLLRMNDKITPYSLTLGEAGAVTPSLVRRQAQEMGIAAEDCIAIGGVRYTSLCKAVFANCKTPLQDNVKGGMGYHMKWMKAKL